MENVNLIRLKKSLENKERTSLFVQSHIDEKVEKISELEKKHNSIVNFYESLKKKYDLFFSITENIVKNEKKINEKINQVIINKSDNSPKGILPVLFIEIKEDDKEENHKIIKRKFNELKTELIEKSLDKLTSFINFENVLFKNQINFLTEAEKNELTVLSIYLKDKVESYSDEIKTELNKYQEYKEVNITKLNVDVDVIDKKLTNINSNLENIKKLYYLNFNEEEIRKEINEKLNEFIIELQKNIGKPVTAKKGLLNYLGLKKSEQTEGIMHELHMKVEVKNETIKLSNILKELKEKLNLKWYNDYFINTLESYEKNIKINIEELNDVIINLKQELEKEIKLLNSKVEEVNELKLEKEREIKSMKTELNVLKDKIKDLEDEIEDVNEKIHYEDLFEDAFDGKPKPAYSGISSSGHGKALK